MGKIKSILQNPVYLLTIPASRGMLKWMSDKRYNMLLYRLSIHKKCNLKNPKTYNEKLQWLKLYDTKPEYGIYADKSAVRKHIEDTLGKEYLIKCYGVYEKTEDIDITNLPDEFVMKCTHDSGSIEICKNKETFDFEAAKARLKKSLKRNYYDVYRERPYKNIKPQVIIEEYLKETDGDLRDYKVYCYGGKAKLFAIHEGRYVEGRTHTQTFYDVKQNKLDISQPGMEYEKGEQTIPEAIDKMIELSEILAKDMIHARIDWYYLDGKIYFGEITLYDGSGFEPFVDKDDEFLGSLISLPL